MLDWRDASGRHQKQFRTKQEAELYRDKLIRERNSERFGTLVDDGLTFDEFSKIYVEKKSWRTETYRERVDWSVKALSSVFGGVRLVAITRTMAEEYQVTRLKSVAASTVRQELPTLSDVFKWAIRLGYAFQNPCRDVERPALDEKQDAPPAYMSPEEFADLVAFAERDLPLYEFAVFTGLRESELLGLEWSDVKDGAVLVRRGKGRKQRLAPLVPQAAAALEKTPRHVRSPRIFWWVRSRFDVYKRFRRRLKWAGMESRFTFHALRHTFGAWASQSGVDLRVIGAVMGHSSVRTTERLYAHLSPSYRRNELQKLAAIRVGTKTVQEERNLSKN